MYRVLYAALKTAILLLAIASAGLVRAQTPAANTPAPGATASVAPISTPNANDSANSSEPPEAAPDNGGSLPDFRTGHFLIYLGGGVSFIPDALAPVVDTNDNVGLNEVAAIGGGAQLMLGVGLNRFLVLGLDGQFGHASLGNDLCGSCTLTTIGTGVGLNYHPTQAFAVDPWLRFAVGYRYSFSSFPLVLLNNGDTARVASESAFEFAKLSIGGDFFPDPVFGFGPYLALDLGLNRLGGTSQVYANVQLGLRLAFDPMRASVSVGSNVASR